MDRKRVFIALLFSDEFKKQLGEEIFELKEKYPKFRWLPEGTWHLTILPPHDWSDAEINLVAESLKNNLKFKNINLESEKIILGPPDQDKRMVWLLFKNSTEFFELQSRVCKIINSVGVALNKQRSKDTIHLTLARFKPDQRFDGFQNRNFTFHTPCSRIELWQAFLDPGGATYQTLASIKLM